LNIKRTKPEWNKKLRGCNIHENKLKPYWEKEEQEKIDFIHDGSEEREEVNIDNPKTWKVINIKILLKKWK
jgi:hypothetical protein